MRPHIRSTDQLVRTSTILATGVGLQAKHSEEERNSSLEAVQEELRKRQEALAKQHDILRQTHKRMYKQLADAERLQNFATQSILINAAELYERILDEAIALLEADFASVQLFLPSVDPAEHFG